MHLTVGARSAVADLTGRPTLDASRSRTADGDDAWLRARVGAGDICAMEILGARLLLVRGTSTITAHPALAYLRAAAQANRPAAMYRLGAFLLDAAAETQPEGESWLRRAAACGLSGAVADLASRLIRGDGMAPAPREGQRLLKEEARRGSRIALLLLASLVLQHGAAEGGHTSGDQLLERAGAADADRMAEAGLLIYARGLAGSLRARRRMAEHAAVLFDTACRRGSRFGALNLAYAVRRGDVPASAHPPLDELLHRSLETGEAIAIVNQALRLAAGVQTPIDWMSGDRLIAGITRPFDAMPWWLLLARSGDPEGHLALGWLVRHGRIHDPDQWPARTRFAAAREGGWLIPGWLAHEPLDARSEPSATPAVAQAFYEGSAPWNSSRDWAS